MPDDPLEVVRDWIGENEIAFEPHLADAFAALENERKECEGDAIGFAEKVDELTAIRAEVNLIATEISVHPAFAGALPKQWAARLRKACE